MKYLIDGLGMLLIVVLSVSYYGSISQRSYWKERCLEIQDNYEALMLENNELKDSLQKYETRDTLELY